MNASETSFYVTGGTLRFDAPCYVERQADTALYATLLQGEFCYVLTPRQMGKSSLMVRTARRLRQEGVAVVVLDLTAIGQNLTPEQWYGGLLERIGQQLGREEELEQFWQARSPVDPLQRWMAAIRAVALESDGRRQTADGSPAKTGQAEALAGADTTDYRLPSPASKLVIFIDEIDTIRSLSFSADEFLAAIRECYDRRSAEPDLHRLTFCLLGVALPTDLAPDPRHSPFRIGRRIPLDDFTEAEALPLARGLNPTSPPAPPLQGEGGPCLSTVPEPQERSMAPPSLAGKAGEPRFGREADSGGGRAPGGGLGPAAPALLRRILHWTGGHPYLTQRLCRAVAEEGRRQTADGRRKSEQDEPSPLPTADDRLPSPADVGRVCERLFLAPGASERDDNLIFVRERLLRSDTDAASVLHLYARMRGGQTVWEDTTDPRIRILWLSGITRTAGGRLRVRNRIYERVFDRSWVRENMPDAEVRRQRTAFRRGLLRAAGVAAACGAVLIGLLLAASVQHRLNLSQRLPDGTTLRLEAVTYGKQHHFEPGHFRLAWLRGLFPPLANLIGPAFDDWTQQSSIVFWLSRRDGGGRYRDFTLLSRAAAIDEHGCSFEVPYQDFHVMAMTSASSGQGAGLSMTPPPGARVVMLYGELPAFPRRARTLRLCFYDQSDRPLAEFSVPNPAPGPYPTWKPEPLPITKRDGNLSFTLTGLTSLLEGNSYVDSKEVERRTIVPTFQVRENGRPTPVWVNGGVEVSDATGNSTMTGDEQRDFCLYEPAWKLRAQFWRTPHARFAPSETWTVRGVSVPKDGTVLRLAGSTTLQGVKLQLIALAGAGRVVYVNGVPWAMGKPAGGRHPGIDVSSQSWDGAPPVPPLVPPPAPGRHPGVGGSSGDADVGSILNVIGRQFRGPVSVVTFDSGLPHVEVRSTGLAADQRLMLKAVDNRAREIFPSGGGVAGDLRCLQLDIPLDARKVDLTFAVQRCRVAEFLVWPPRPWCCPEFQLHQPGSKVLALAFSPDGKTLAVAGGTGEQRATQPGAVTLWDVATREARVVLDGHRGLVDAVAFSPDGGTIVTGSYDHTVRLWDAAGRPRAVLRRHTGPVRGLAFTRDGQRFATAGEDGTAILWDLRTRKPQATFHNDDGGLTCVALSPDGKTLAVGIARGRTGKVKLWDTVSHKLRAILKSRPNGVGALAFSPDGKILVVGNHADTPQFWGPEFWDLTTGRVRRAPGEPVNGIAFSPDRKLLATAEGGGVKLRDAATGQERGWLLMMGAEARSIAFSPDGRLLALGLTAAPWPPMGPAVRVWRVFDDAQTPLER